MPAGLGPIVSQTLSPDKDFIWNNFIMYFPREDPKIYIYKSYLSAQQSDPKTPILFYEDQ